MRSIRHALTLHKITWVGFVGDLEAATVQQHHDTVSRRVRDEVLFRMGAVFGYPVNVNLSSWPIDIAFQRSVSNRL